MIYTDEHLKQNDEKLYSLKDKYIGRRCFVIGNGPSLTIEDLDRLKGEITFASNRIYLAFEKTAWRPTFYTVCDALVGKNNLSIIKKLPCEKIFSGSVREFFYDEPSAVFLNFPRSQDEIDNWIDDKGIVRMNPGTIQSNPGKNRCEDSELEKLRNDISWPVSWNLLRGARAGHSVINLDLKIAYWMGFTDVYVIGCDHNFIVPDTKTGEKIYHNDVIVSEGEVNHFHKDYRKQGEKWTVPQLDIMAEEFAYARKVFESDGRKIRNASRCTKLNTWERVNFDEISNLSIISKKSCDIKISVILSNYNGSKYLNEAIQSVIEQDYDNWELILVDDGSTDNSGEIIKKFSDLYPEKIIALFEADNQGQAAGFNKGFNVSQGELIAFLDSDDLWMPDKLQKLVDFVSDNGTAAIYQHNLYLIRDGAFTTTPFRPLLKSGDIYKETLKNKSLPSFVATSGLAFSRNILKKVMPIPIEFRTCADGYLTRTSFCHGPVASCMASWGYYRVHDGNNVFENPEHDNKQYVNKLLIPALHKYYQHIGAELRYKKSKGAVNGNLNSISGAVSKENTANLITNNNETDTDQTKLVICTEEYVNQSRFFTDQQDVIILTMDSLIIGTGWLEVENEKSVYFRKLGPSNTGTIHIHPRRDIENRLNIVIRSNKPEKLLNNISIEADGVILNKILNTHGVVSYITSILPKNPCKSNGTPTVLRIKAEKNDVVEVKERENNSEHAYVALQGIYVFPLGRPLFIAEKYTDSTPFNGLEYMQNNPGVRDGVVHGIYPSAYAYYRKNIKNAGRYIPALNEWFDECPGDHFDIMMESIKRHKEKQENIYVQEINMLRSMIYRQGDSIRSIKNQISEIRTYLSKNMELEKKMTDDS